MTKAFFQRALVGADGTDASQLAIDVAIALAKRFGSELHCIGVIRPPSPETEAEVVGFEQLERDHKAIRDQVGSCADRARGEGVQAITVELDGDPESVIENYGLENEFDIIIVGHHHLNRFRRFLEGSTSDSLVEHSSASVLVVRAPSQES